MKKLTYIFLMLIYTTATTFAQDQNGGVSIGKSGEKAHPNAILELYSDSKGLLVPRVTTETIEQMFPEAEPTAEGLMLYDLERKKFFYYDGNEWLPIGGGLERFYSDTIVGEVGDFDTIVADDIITHMAEIDTLINVYGQVDNLITHMANIDSLIVSDLLKALIAKIDTIQSEYASINELHTITAKIDNLVSQVGEFDKLLVNSDMVAGAITADSLTALVALIDSMMAEYARIEQLVADEASIINLTGQVAQFDTVKIHNLLSASEISADSLRLVMGVIDSLKSGYAQITKLISAQGTIDNLTGQLAQFDTVKIHNLLSTREISADSLRLVMGLIDSLKSGYAQITKLISAQGTIDNLTGQVAQFDTVKIHNLLSASEISADSLRLVMGLIDSLKSGYAQITKLISAQGTIDNLTGQLAQFDTVEIHNLLSASEISADSLRLIQGLIDSLLSDYAAIERLATEQANITYLTGQSALIDSLTITEIIQSKSILSDSISGLIASLDTILSEFLNVSELISDQAEITRLNSDSIYVTSVIGTDISFDKVTADSSFLGYVWADSLITEWAKLDYLLTQLIEADTAVIRSFESEVAATDTLIIGGDTILNVAKAGDVIINEKQTVATVEYVESQVNASTNFNYDRQISRTSWDFAGMNVSGGVTEGNVVDFLNRIFFPVPAPVVNQFTITSPGTSVPFSVWRSFGAEMDFDFHYKVTNTSKVNTNVGDETDLTSLDISFGGVVQASADLSGQGDVIEGNLTGIKVDKPAAHIGDSFDFKLEVEDAYPNKVEAILSVVLTDAIGLTQSNPSLDGSTNTKIFERDNTDKTVTLGWNITANDESVVDIYIDGSAIGNSSASGNVTRTFSGSEPSRTRWSVNAEGDLYGMVAANIKNTPYAYWGDARYYGLSTKSSGFTLADILALPSSSGGKKEVRIAPAHLFAQAPNSGKTTGDVDYFTTVYEFLPDGLGTYYLTFASLDDGNYAIWLLNLGTWSQQTTEKFAITYENGAFTATYYVYVLTGLSYNAAGSVKAVLGPKL